MTLHLVQPAPARPERKGGEILRDMKANGERVERGSGLKAQAAPSLSDLGIHRDDSKRWQKIAEIPAT